MKLGHFMGFGAVGVPVVVSDPRPVASDQFGDCELGGMICCGQSPTRSLPFRDVAGVLGPARCGAVLAEQHVAANAEAVRERDDGLARLFVFAVNQKMVAFGYGPTLS